MIHSRWLEQTVRIALDFCSIDPITLTGLALAASGAAAGAGVAALAGGGSSGATPAPPPAPSATPAIQQPTGQKAGGGANTPSFVGSSAAPSQVGYGQKTLLGQ